VVLTLTREQGAALERRLAGERFAFRPVPHAVFSAKGAGLVATLYESGKLVIQGESPEAFAAQFLGSVALPTPVAGRGDKPSPRPPEDVETWVGSDESGKGDYFGPLVVAGVRLEPGDATALLGGPVKDCKLLSDAACLRLGPALRERFAHAVARLDPPEYNARHAALRNLNPLLAELHAQVIRELARPGMRVVVDQFAKESVLERALGGLDIRLEQRPRAEELAAVAAASIIARQEFLVRLRELSQEFAVELAKGAGPPTDRAAKQFVLLHGVERLGAVAKLHFKNTQKIQVRGRA
jgi:ribonuclease HIII